MTTQTYNSGNANSGGQETLVILGPGGDFLTQTSAQGRRLMQGPTTWE